MERVLLHDALLFVERRTGFEIERRTAQRWAEAGRVRINGEEIELETTQIVRRWWIARQSLERLIAALLDSASCAPSG